MKAVPSAPTPLLESDKTELLGLKPDQLTPAQIIWAAQMRLRRFRLSQPGGGRGHGADDARRIMAARDALLRQTVGVITRGRLGSPDS
jgi:hypothetical protein